MLRALEKHQKCDSFSTRGRMGGYGEGRQSGRAFKRWTRTGSWMHWELTVRADRKHSPSGVQKIVSQAHKRWIKAAQQDTDAGSQGNVRRDDMMWCSWCEWIHILHISWCEWIHILSKHLVLLRCLAYETCLVNVTWFLWDQSRERIHSCVTK